MRNCESFHESENHFVYWTAQISLLENMQESQIVVIPLLEDTYNMSTQFSTSSSSYINVCIHSTLFFYTERVFQWCGTIHETAKPSPIV